MIPLKSNVDRNAATEAAAWATESVQRNELRTASQEAESQPNLLRIVRILRRRSAMILTIAIAGTCLAILAALLVPPKYTAVAQLLVEPVTDGGGREAYSTAAMDEALDTHLTLLLSHEHLRRVARYLRAASSPDKIAANPVATDRAADPASGVTSHRVEARREQQSANVISKMAERARMWLGAFSSARQPQERLSVQEIMRNVRVMRERRSRVISVAFTSSDPLDAASAANAVVEQYVTELAQSKSAGADSELQRIRSRIDQLKGELTAVRSTLQEHYREQASIPHSPAGETEAAPQGAASTDLEQQFHAMTESYSKLLAHKKLLDETKDAVSPGVRLYSSASVPEWPSSHNPLFFIIPAFLVLLMGSSLLAIGLESLDLGVRQVRDVQRLLGVQNVSLLPMTRNRHSAVLLPQTVLASEAAVYNEALRSTISALAVPLPNNGRTIFITSSVPGEGKTTLARSLAAHLAALGHKTVVANFDTALSAPNNDDDHIPAANDDGPVPGLSIVPAPGSSGTAPFDLTSFVDLDIDPLAPSSMAQIKNLLEKLKAKYDYVILDGPALLHLVDARLLSLAADQTIFVVRWASTRRDVVQNAFTSLREKVPSLRAAASPIVVLTQVNLSRQSHYHFGDWAEIATRYCRHIARASPPPSHASTSHSFSQTKSKGGAK